MRKTIIILAAFFAVLFSAHLAKACAWGSSETSHISMLDYFLLKECTDNKYFFYNRYIAACKGYPHCNKRNFEYDTYFQPKSYNIANPKAKPEDNDYDTPLEISLDLNIAAWKEIIATKASELVVGDIVYRTSFDTLSMLAEKIENPDKQLPNYLTDNDFAQEIIRQKRSDIIKYLCYAKRCEPFALLEWEWVGWTEEGDTKTSNLSSDMVAAMTGSRMEGMALLEQEKNPMLRQRYLYQLVRLSYFLKDFDEVQKLCNEQLTADMPLNYIDSRLLGRKAGALFRLNRIPEAAYQYALIYQKYKNSDLAFAERSYINFRTLMNETKHWQACLALAKTDQERATLWYLHGLVGSYSSYNYFEMPSGKAYDVFTTENIKILENIWKNNPTDETAEIWLWRNLQIFEDDYFKPMLAQSSIKADTSAYRAAEHNIVNFTPISAENVKESSIWDGIARFFANLWEAITGFFSSSPQPTLAKKNDSTSVVNDEYESYYQNDFYIDNALMFTSFSSPQEKTQKTLHFNNFKRLVEKIATANNTSQPALWHLSLAYLHIMDKSWAKAQAAINQTKAAFESKKEQNGYILKQADLLEQYILLEQQQRIETAYEEKLVHFFETQNDTTYHFNQLFYNRLGQKYLAQNEFKKGVMALHRAKSVSSVAVLLDMYASDNQFADILDDAKKAKEGGVMAVYLKQYFFTPDQLAEMQAVRLARENQFAQALSILRKLPKSYWKSNDIQTFEASLGNRFEPQDYKMYNHLQFYEMIDSLQQVAKNQPDNAKKSFTEIGNALWSSAYWAYNNDLWHGGLGEVAAWFDGTRYPLNVSDTLSTKIYVGKRRLLNRYGTSLLAGKYYQEVAKLDDGTLGRQACYLTLSLSKRTKTTFHPEGSYLTDFKEVAKQWTKVFASQPETLPMLKECPALKDLKPQKEV